MTIEELFKNVAVIGAAGKMGSGISLSLLQEMARLEAEKTGAVGSGLFRINLIDSQESALIGLRKYLRTQMTKYAEKQINNLRKYYAANTRLVSNEEIIQAFVEGSMDMVLSDTQIDNAKSAKLVFEAIIEDIGIKIKLFSTLKTLCGEDTLFLTNTSSIPISELNARSGLHNRIIGFHFYNPASVQKLVEVVYPENCTKEQKDIIQELAKQLGKTAIPSRDIAGFIGNGHFIREVVFACQKVQELSSSYTLPQAIYLVNKVTQEYLLRPMGIFQLIDYVGVDVCQKIAFIMKTHLKDSDIHADLLDKMVEQKILGGQYSDGSQKPGFFTYERGRTKAVYDLKAGSYQDLNDDWKADCEKAIGSLPQNYPSWRGLQSLKERDETIQKALAEMLQQDTMGSKLANEFLLHSASIAFQLLEDKVAAQMTDIKAVLNQGFFHLYGPEVMEQLK